MKKNVFIIAEAGVNHNGSLKLAKRLVDGAKYAGADAVKFQMFTADNLVTKSALKADYQKASSNGYSQYEMLKTLELKKQDFAELGKYCRKRNIVFLATPFDDNSALFLNKMGMKIFKISSGDLNNIPFISKIAKFKRPMIISTGMSDTAEIKEAVKAVFTAGNKNLTLLHCTSNYPAKYADVNLNAIKTLEKTFKLPAGYSDHTLGIEVSIAAAAMGAKVIEKHFTLDKTMKGPDHKASLSIIELKAMVSAIRNVEISMGNGIKIPRKSEDNVKAAARKSIVAARDIKKGEKIRQSMLAVKRPGTGLAPGCLYKITGKTAKKNIKCDALVRMEDLI